MGTLTYRQAHDRLRKERGRASEHACVDCGEQAHDWSYVGNCPEQLWGWKGWKNGYPDPARYCLHLDHYDPRCKSCHRVYDSKGAGQVPKYVGGDVPFKTDPKGGRGAVSR